jgi:uncharacterized membrane protein
MKFNIKNYLIVLILFLVIDLPMITTINGKLYQDQFNIINNGPMIITYKSIIGAVLAYLSLGLSINYFVLSENLSKKDLFIRGAILGFISYSIYNGTNLFTINDYSLKTGIVDTLWGTLLLGTISVLASYIIEKI